MVTHDLIDFSDRMGSKTRSKGRNDESISTF